jgi:DNA polymerase I
MNSKKNTLFLLDAMALIYRAHFAFSKNPRVNSKGMNTGAALGFTNSLWDIISNEQPTHIAVAFDADGPTFRHDQYQEYKANREEQPEDIRVAIPYVKKIVEAFNIKGLELKGYEADDIIGTFAKKASAEGYEVFMMTPDKDYCQLVDERIKLYKPAYMGNSVEVLGVEEVLKKFDIDKVEQVCDILGLQGDSVDNIPGIPGIGAKTASKLLKQFGSVEAIVAGADQLKGKQKEKITEYGKQGILSKELATIDTSVPLDFNADSLEYSSPDEEQLRGLFHELEFRTLGKRVFGEEPGQPASFRQTSLFGQEKEKAADKELKTIASVNHDYILVDSDEKKDKLLAALRKTDAYCFDTETDSLVAQKANLVGISFAMKPHEAWYIPVSGDFDTAKKEVETFREVLESDEKLIIGQNLKYDLLVLRKYGIRVGKNLFDTMVAHYLIDPEGRHNMNALAENYLDYEPVSIESLIGGKGKNQGSMRDVPLNKLAEYAGEDADITLQLKEKLEPLLKKNELQKLFYEVEIPLIPVLTEMEYEGIRVNDETLKQTSRELGEDITAIEKEVFEMAGESFNIGSPKQLGDILFDKLKLDDKPKKTKSGQYATGEEILSKLAIEHKIASRILDYRELVKLKNTYVDALPKLIYKRDQRIHTSFNQTVTSTGRLSSTNPNLQNIPIRTEKGRLIRRAFEPRSKDFTLMAADYSQIELRIMAAFAEDESMIEAFQNGRDIHATTASKIFKISLDEVDKDMRRKAKTANFGIIYGISAFGLSQRLSIPRSEASDIIKAYFEEFPAVKAYMDKVKEEARKTGYVSTHMGRKRFLRDINSANNTLKGYAERNAINTPIQGSAADMIKVAMVNVFRWMTREKLQSQMILQVHDELVFDVHKNEKDVMKENVVRLMKEAMPLQVPMEVEAGFADNWLDAH